MTSPALLARVFLPFLMLVPLGQAPERTKSAIPRIPLEQEQLCCFNMHFVKPEYPKEARLAHTEGVVKVILIIADDGSVADVQAVSGEPILLDSTMKAVRQWYVSIAREVDHPRETEVDLVFTFKIEDPPKPAYLHLKNGKMIRANSVREFTDGIEYTVGWRTYHISSDSVTDINACARIAIIGPHREGDCTASGGPSFVIRAIPLFSAGKREHASNPASR